MSESESIGPFLLHQKQMWRTKRPAKCAFPQAQPIPKPRDQLGDTWHEPKRTAIAVSLMSQAKGPGRATLGNADSAGFGNFQVLDANPAYAKLDGLSSSKFICGYDDPWVADLYDHIKTALGDHPVQHSAAYTGNNRWKKRKNAVHSNFGKSKNRMQTICKEVGTKLDALADQKGFTNMVGTEVCSASIFGGAKPKVDNSSAEAEMKPFLKKHMDTHQLPVLFGSISKGASSVNYTKEDKVVAKLIVPAGLSIIVTTEIHSGLKDFNTEGLMHFSETEEDRALFRIVHKAPTGGLYMERGVTEWKQFVGEALSAVFPMKK